MPEIHFDRYYRYDELTDLLHAFAQEYPQLVQLESLGQSYEGRDIWLATVTNFETGPAAEKPALWTDGNIHASEVSPSSACLYLLNKLVTTYGNDEDSTRCLDTRAFYICPRVNPDGAEWALADVPKIIRSSTRPYPYDEDPIDGLVQEDMDGDGRMLYMRIPDPNGPWKAYPEDPRLLIRRDPIETDGEYYRLFPEGRIENYDGKHIFRQKAKEGLDLNRNFPGEWRGEGEQAGAGFYPVSEPETRATVDFIARHANIIGGITFHTWSGVILRPYDMKSDETMPAEDLWAFKKIGNKGTDLIGYPNISVYHDFRYHPKQVISGAFDEWLYDQRGVFSWTVEIWSPQQQAGIEDYKFIEWFREHPIEDDLKLLKWSDEVLDGKGYIDWYEFDHPQLGKVELGGWDMSYSWRNPPPQFLEKEIAPMADWAIWHLLISPRLELFDVSVSPLGGGTYQVELTVQNTGWLPSYGSKKALERKIVRGVVCEIELPEDANLKTGQSRQDIGQLEGRSTTPSAATPWWAMPMDTADRATATWVVQAPNGGKVKLIARHQRAGTIRTEIELD